MLHVLVVSGFWAVFIFLFVVCGGGVCFCLFRGFFVVFNLLSEHTVGSHIYERMKFH